MVYKLKYIKPKCINFQHNFERSSSLPIHIAVLVLSYFNAVIFFKLVQSKYTFFTHRYHASMSNIIVYDSVEQIIIYYSYSFSFITFLSEFCRRRDGSPIFPILDSIFPIRHFQCFQILLHSMYPSIS